MVSRANKLPELAIYYLLPPRELGFLSKNFKVSLVVLA
jgi:hypothetical protein